MKNLIQIISVILLLVSCQIRQSKEAAKNLSSNEDDVNVLQKQANDFLNTLNYSQAEKLIQKAIAKKPSSALYLDLFRIYTVSGRNELADNAIKRAITADKSNPDSYYLNAKYLFMKYKEDSIEIVLQNFNKANQLGNKSAKDYIDIINTAEKYKRCFTGEDIDGLIEITYPDAISSFYTSRDVARQEFKKAFNQLHNLGSKIVDWEYFIPDQVFTNGNNKIAKIKSVTTLLVRDKNIPIQTADYIILISTSNGNDWFTISYQTSHKQYLSQFFNPEILNKILK